MSDKTDSAAIMADRIAKLLGRRNKPSKMEQPVSERARAAAKRAWVDGGGDESRCVALVKQYLAEDTEAWEYLLRRDRDKPKTSEELALR